MSGPWNDVWCVYHLVFNLGQGGKSLQYRVISSVCVPKCLLLSIPPTLLWLDPVPVTFWRDGFGRLPVLLTTMYSPLPSYEVRLLSLSLFTSFRFYRLYLSPLPLRVFPSVPLLGTTYVIPYKREIWFRYLWYFYRTPLIILLRP